MASKASAGEPSKRGTAAPGDVEAFLASLDHPSRAEILALRLIMLEADPAITEGIKWNAPSFRTSEYFATFHLRAKVGTQVILHFGAKQRDSAAARLAIADPDELLEWLADDRAAVRFRDMKDVRTKGSAFANVVRQWIEHVQP